MAATNEPDYSSDEFRMYSFKIKRCSRTRSHDWTECPFAHRGEKARRRDPRKFNYSAIACPDFRNGECLKGESCEFAHGVFEYWLHPARYRTRVCNAGRLCQRKVCFFAHTAEQLRVEIKQKCSLGHRVRSEGSSGTALARAVPEMRKVKERGRGMDLEFLESLRGLKIRDCGDEVGFGGGFEWDLDLNFNLEDSTDLMPEHINWISDLLD
ncbi:hypothetical protein RJ641_033906 [Dillenia turbinata]|uniref:C3H1-type domain-containing protein n=1 Tax=Dillenia turbinata TaxID=194707 RepID=A0AAN8VVJ9_9MAGN